MLEICGLQSAVSAGNLHRSHGIQHWGSSMAPKPRYSTEHGGKAVPEDRGLEELILRKARSIIP